MRYYIGKWQIINGIYMPPDGMLGGMDFRSLPDQSNLNQDGYGLFYGNSILDSDYDFLGTGDISDIGSTGRIKSIFSTLLGYRPQGDKLSNLIMDILTTGSHPDGLAGVRSLMPGVDKLTVSLGFHGIIHSEKFDKRHTHFSKVRDVLRESYKQIEGTSTGEEHRKFLTMKGIQFGIPDPENHFIPTGMKKERPLKPSTEFIESFPVNGGDLTTAQDLTWDNNPAQHAVVSGELAINAFVSAASYTIEAEHDLSNDDMTLQVEVTTLDQPTGTFDAFNEAAIVCRMNGTVDGYRYAKRNSDGTVPAPGTQEYSVTKRVGSVPTTLIPLTAVSPHEFFIGPLKITAVGSTIIYGSQGFLTDTSLTGQLRGGLRFEYDDGAAGEVSVDDFVITDEDIIDVLPIARETPLKTTTGCFIQSPFVGAQLISLPFDPKVMIFYSNNNLENSGDFALADISQPNANLSMGFAVASGLGEFGVFPQCAVSQYTKHGGDSVTGSIRSHTPSGCFLMVGEDEANNPGENNFGTIANAQITSMGTLTTLNWEQTDGIPREICYLAIGGDELNNVAIKQVNTPSDSGAVQYDGLGFQPGLLMALSAGIADSGRVPPQLDSTLSFGFGTGSGIGQQYANSSFTNYQIDPSKNQPTLRSYATQSDTNIIALNNESPVNAFPSTTKFEVSAAFSGVHSDGFSLDWTGVDGSGTQSFVLALEGNLYQVGTFDSPNVTSPTYPVAIEQTITGFGFRPIATILGTHGRSGYTNRGGTVGPIQNWSFTNEDIDFDVRDAPESTMLFQTIGLYSPNQAVTINRSAGINARVIELRNPDNSLSFIRTGNLSSFNNDGMTFDWTMYNGLTGSYGYLAFGSKFSIGDMDYSIQGSLASGVSENTQFVIDANNIPENLPFNIRGGVSDDIHFSIGGIDSASGDFNFFTVARVPDNSGIDMFTQVNPTGSGFHDVFDMFTIGPKPANGNMNMSIQVNDRVSVSSSGDGQTDAGMFMWSTVNPGLREFHDMMIKNTNIGPFASMNMNIPNVDTGDTTSNMNMYMKNGTNADGSDNLNDNITFAISASGTIETATFFTQGLGITDGSEPYNDNMNMVIYSNTAMESTNFYMLGPSGINDNITFHMAGQTSNSGVSFFMNSIDTHTGSNNLFTRGF